MQWERICPICGGNMEQRKSDAEACAGTAYGRRLSLFFSCENEGCDFGLAFPFDAEVYVTYTCEELRRRTRTLPADQRVEALLGALSYCRQSGEDALAEALTARVNVIFMEALGEILRRAREMLRALAYREPNEDVRLEMRQKLRVFLRFLDRIEGRYPTERLEAEFHTLRDSLPLMDYHYELGMLALSENSSAAEDHFEEGARAGGIRSRVAYVKYILSERAEDEEDRIAVKEAFARLASESQEACYEYVRRAEAGIDPISEILRTYADQTYPSLSNEGKIAFIRLGLTACAETFEPTLAALQAMPVVRADGDHFARPRAVLSDFERLICDVSDQCEALIRSFDGFGIGADTQSDFAAEQIAAAEENALLEYMIGCAMYYRSSIDFDKRFDPAYLREAIGHFSAFLASELIGGTAESMLDIPSLIGFRNLSALRSNAERYRRALRESAGFEEEE